MIFTSNSSSASVCLKPIRRHLQPSNAHNVMYRFCLDSFIDIYKSLTLFSLLIIINPFLLNIYGITLKRNKTFFSTSHLAHFSSCIATGLLLSVFLPPFDALFTLIFLGDNPQRLLSTIRHVFS